MTKKWLDLLLFAPVNFTIRAYIRFTILFFLSFCRAQMNCFRRLFVVVVVDVYSSLFRLLLCSQSVTWLLLLMMILFFSFLYSFFLSFLWFYYLFCCYLSHRLARCFHRKNWFCQFYAPQCECQSLQCTSCSSYFLFFSFFYLTLASTQTRFCFLSCYSDENSCRTNKWTE